MFENDYLVLVKVDNDKKTYAVAYRKEPKSDWFIENGYDVILRLSTDSEAKHKRDFLHMFYKDSGYKNENMAN